MLSKPEIVNAWWSGGGLPAGGPLDSPWLLTQLRNLEPTRLQTQGLDGGLNLDIKSPFSFGGDPEL